MVVRVVNEFYLISVSGDRMELIDKVEDKEAKDLFKLEASKKASKKNTFFRVCS